MAKAGAIRAGRAFVELFADDSKLVRGLKRAEARLKAFGNRIRNLGLRIAGLGAAVLTPLLGAAKTFSSMGDQVAKMAKRTGLSTEVLSELRFVASQTGTEFESLEMAFRRMQRSIYDAGRGLSTSVDALADLGLRFEHLDGLSPEEQFKLLADRLGAVEDPTKRAAIAMTLFGRTGTNLLPMFEAGAAGIDALQEKARALGLTMSAEDAKAAEDFTDALDALWKVVKMGLFRVGAALAPTLQDLAERFTDIAVRAGAWIKRNRSLVVTVLKVAASVVALGVALVILGTLVSALGSVLGMLAAVGTTVGTVLTLLGVVLGWLVTPIGLVITAVAALGAYIVYATGASGKALVWLADRFGDLRDDAVASYRGIADALVASDIALAARVLWLSLKMEWTRGINFLEKAWLNFRNFFIRVGYDAWHGMLATAEYVWHAMQVGWIEVMSFLSRIWTRFSAWQQKDTLDLSRNLARTWIWLKKQFDSTYDYEAARGAVDAFYRQQERAIDEAANQAYAELEQRRRRERRESARVHEGTLAEIDRQNREKHRELEEDYQRRLAGNEADLARARKEWQEALGQARRKREAREVEGPTALEGPEGLLAKVRDSLAGLDDLLEVVRERTIGVAGTFNAAALLGLQAGGMEDRIANASDRTAKATEETAKTAKKLLQAAEEGGLAFT